MNSVEKAAYIKGLADGLKLSENTPEGQVLKQLLDLVSSLASEVASNQENIAELQEYVEEIDDDLAVLEDEVYGDEEEFEEDDEEDEDETGFYQTECPNCGDVVCFDESIDPTDLVCPNCGEKFSCELTSDSIDEE